MPEYLYKNPKTKKIISIIQGMNEEHSYVDEDGLIWDRVLVAPQVNGEAPIDPWNNGDFIEKTGKMKGSYGDILDKSKELSAKRAGERDGVDPIQKKYFDDYAKTRKGARHLSDSKPLDNKNVRVDY